MLQDGFFLDERLYNLQNHLTHPANAHTDTQTHTHTIEVPLTQ